MTARHSRGRGRGRGRAGWWLLALCAVAGGAAALWLRSGGVVYDTVTVGRSTIEDKVTAIGTLQPRRYVDVGAQVSGQINRLHVQPGSEVKKGQLLVEIDPSVQQATVDGGRAALAGLRAQLADQQAQHRLTQLQNARQQALVRANATRLEDAQIAEAAEASAGAKLDHLRAQIDQTQATLKADEARLGYTRIFAPMAGTVVSLDAREGQTLNATYQTPNILRIADLSAMTVWTEVSEADVRRVKPGMPVYFTTLGSQELRAPRRWAGTVRQVLPAPPAAEAAQGGGNAAAPVAVKAVVYTVLFDVDNADGELMPQMTAQTSFITAQAKNVLSVPLAALAEKPVDLTTSAPAPASADGASPIAGVHPAPDTPSRAAARYTARVQRADGSIETREVQLAVRNRHMAEVREGLQEGEQLVTGERAANSGPSRFRF